MQYDLELTRIIEKINEQRVKKVLIQLSDGLKPEAKVIADKITKETEAEVLIWLGSCFGACDVPLGMDMLDVDLIIQFGHNMFRKQEGW
jgi:diphthamide biosynthesis enzyme Dph1/Dph2-like protein